MRYQRVILMGLVVLCGAFALIQWRRYCGNKVRIQMAELKSGELHKDLKGKNSRSELSRTAAVPALSASMSNKPIGIEIKGRISRLPSPPSDPFDFTKLFANSPAFHAAYLTAYQKAVSLEFALLFRQLNWPQDKIESFCRVVGKSMEDFTDIRSAAATQGLGESDSVIKQLNEKRIETRAADLKELLGVDDYSKYIEYSEQTVERGRVLAAATLLASTERAFSSEQIATLTQELVAAKLSPHTENGVTSYPLPEQYLRVIENARKTLSPNQLEAFRLMIESQKAEHDLRRFSDEKRIGR